MSCAHDCAPGSAPRPRPYDRGVSIPGPYPGPRACRTVTLRRVCRCRDSCHFPMSSVACDPERVERRHPYAKALSLSFTFFFLVFCSSRVKAYLKAPAGGP